MKVLLAFCGLIALSLAKPGPGHPTQEILLCNGETMKMPEDLTKGSAQCEAKVYGTAMMDAKDKEKDMKDSKTSKEKIEDFEKNFKPKMGCVLVCKLKFLNLLGPDGKVNKEKYSAYLAEKVFSKELSEKVVVASEKCFQVKPTLVFKEDACENNADIMKLMECVAKEVSDICGL